MPVPVAAAAPAPNVHTAVTRPPAPAYVPGSSGTASKPPARPVTEGPRVQSTRASYALVSRRYAAGAAPPVELLDARTALTRAEVDRVSSSYELAIKLVELERVAALAPEVTP